MSDKTQRLKKNTLLVFMGSAGSRLISFIMLPLYTKWLSVDEYGLTDILTVYVTFLFSFVTCCISESIFIFPKNQEYEKQKSFYSSALCFLFIMLILTAGLFIGIRALSSEYAIKNSFTDNIWLIYFMLLTEIVMKVSQQFTRSIDKMLVYSITGIISAISTAIYAFMLIPKHGVEGYVWSIILAHLTAGIYSFIFSKSYLYIDFKSIKKKSLSLLLSYSIPLIPNSVMWWIVHAINRPIMETNLGLHDIGIYAVANKFPSIITMIFGIFTTSWQISVLEEFGKEGYSSFYNKVLRFVYVLLISLLLILTLSSKLIINLFVDEKYYEAWRYIPLLALGAVLSSISGITGSHFSATKESKYYFYSSIWGAIVAILLNILLIPTWGLYGVCVAVIVSFGAMAVSRIVYSWRYVHIENIHLYLISLVLITILICLYVANICNVLIYVFAFLYMIMLLYFNRDIFNSFFYEFRKKHKNSM